MKPFTFCIAAAVCAFSMVAAEPTDSLSYNLSDLVVTGSRTQTDARQLPMNVTTIGRTEIEQSNQPTLQQLITRSVPGVFSTARGIMGFGVSGGSAGTITSRGMGASHPAQMVVLIDGHPQYMGLMGHPIADSYQSLIADRVEVVRGPASVIYGSNAMGGVINIITRRVQENGVNGVAKVGGGSYGTFESEMTVQGRYDGFTATVSGSYNRTDGHRRDMAFDQATGFGKFGYKFSDAWNATLDFNILNFDAQNPGSVYAPLIDCVQDITRGMASASVNNRYDRASGSVSVFYNWGNHSINDGHAPDKAPKQYRFISRDKMLGASAFETLTITDKTWLTVGADYFLFGGKAWNRYFDKRPNQNLCDTTQYEVAGYVDLRQDIGNVVTIDGGIRYDYHNGAGGQWIPQIGASVRPWHHSTFKTLVSKGFRYPTLREMFMFPPQNPDLKPEEMWNYEVSYRNRGLVDGLDFGACVFYLDATNLIEVAKVDGRNLNVNTGRVKNLGAEIDAQWQISKHWNVGANYSYLHMDKPLLASPTHKLNLNAGYRWRGLAINTNIQLIDKLYTQTAPTEQTESFVLWDMNASYDLNEYVQFWVRGENLLAQKYEINYGFPMPRATAIGGLKLKF